MVVSLVSLPYTTMVPRCEQDPNSRHEHIQTSQQRTQASSRHSLLKKAKCSYKVLRGIETCRACILVYVTVITRLINDVISLVGRVKEGGEKERWVEPLINIITLSSFCYIEQCLNK